MKHRGPREKASRPAGGFQTDRQGKGERKNNQQHRRGIKSVTAFKLTEEKRGWCEVTEGEVKEKEMDDRRKSRLYNLVVSNVLVHAGIDDIRDVDGLDVFEQDKAPHSNDGNGKTVAHKEHRFVFQGITN